LRDLKREKQIVDNTIRYRFDSNDETYKIFPYQFSVEQQITLQNSKAELSLDVINTGDKILPFAPGHHSYYRVPLSEKCNIQLSDNVTLSAEDKQIWLSGAHAVSIQNPGTMELFIPTIGRLKLSFDADF